MFYFEEKKNGYNEKIQVNKANVGCRALQKETEILFYKIIYLYQTMSLYWITKYCFTK